MRFKPLSSHWLCYRILPPSWRICTFLTHCVVWCMLTLQPTKQSFVGKCAITLPLCFLYTGQELVMWPIGSLRRYGVNNVCFTIVTGRCVTLRPRCSIHTDLVDLCVYVKAHGCFYCFCLNVLRALMPLDTQWCLLFAPQVLHHGWGSLSVLHTAEQAHSQQGTCHGHTEGSEKFRGE